MPATMTLFCRIHRMHLIQTTKLLIIHRLSFPSFVVPLETLSAPVADDSGMKRSLEDLETRSHAIRQTIAAEEQSDKETGATYVRHVKNYELWWDLFQADLRNETTSHIVIPAFPIIPAKVSLFIKQYVHRCGILCCVGRYLFTD
jgi:hypothetical protein